MISLLMITIFQHGSDESGGEIESFLDSVRTRQQPRVTARQGRDALALALEIQTSMAAHAHRAGLEDFFAPGA